MGFKGTERAQLFNNTEKFSINVHQDSLTTPQPGAYRRVLMPRYLGVYLVLRIMIKTLMLCKVRSLKSGGLVFRGAAAASARLFILGSASAGLAGVRWRLQGAKL